MNPFRIRLLLSLAASLVTSTIAFAHGSMDLSVRVSAPAFMQAQQTERLTVTADIEAFDAAYAVLITVDTDAQFLAYAAPSAWRCTRETKRVRCTVDELGPGPHDFTVDVAVPPGGNVNTIATIISIAADDPEPSNNSHTARSSVYAASSCTAGAPVILSAGTTTDGGAEVVWSPAAGATSYDVLAGLDGETPRIVTTTTSTRAATRAVGGGDVRWIVRANFANCPSLESGDLTVAIGGTGERLAVTSVTSPLFVEPVALAFLDNSILIADAGLPGLLTYFPGENRAFVERLGGDATANPPGGNGGITYGPGRFLYLADPSNHLVRLAYPEQPRPTFTLAGSLRAAGSNDGVGTAARVRGPLGVAVDEQSRVYITDSGNHTIRRGIFDMPKGEFAIVTIAGAAGQSGSADGTGSAARFNDPAGIAVDADGNVYIADRGNHTIRRMTPSGAVTTIAGVAGQAGHRNGIGAEALFNRPLGIAVDARGNLFVTEEGNHTLRRIAPNRRVTTVAGQPGAAGASDGTGTEARFNRPAMLAVAADGSIWIADAGNGKLRKAVFAPPPGPKRRAARS